MWVKHFANINWLGTTDWSKLLWNLTDLVETQLHQTVPLPWLPEAAPEFGIWLEEQEVPPNTEQGGAESLGEKKEKGLGKKNRNFLVSLGVCLEFLMSEFNHDLGVFHQKLEQTKLVPVQETNSDGKKTHHNSTPQHPSTVQQPPEKPSGTRKDMFKGRKISREPSILFWNLYKIWHLQRIEQQVFSEVLNQKFKSRKVNSWSHQKCCDMTFNAKFKFPHSPFISFF